MSMAAAMILGRPVALCAQEPASQPGQGEGAALAKKLSNPISDLVSVPFQFNWEQGVGPSDQTRFVLNVQPVVPFSLNSSWNLVGRVVMPFLTQPALFEGGSPSFGVSDLVVSAFFSPAKEDGPMWGVGPVVTLPSTTQPTLGSEKWSVGPTFVVLQQAGPWTYGMLWNQVWSFAGNADRSDVSQMFLQPFLSYQTKGLLTFAIQSEATANWKAEAGQEWSVPINVSVSRLASFGTFPASYSFGVGVFAAKPDIGPSWKIRGGMTLLLPRRK
jgi:hypothetical protein